MKNIFVLLCIIKVFVWVPAFSNESWCSQELIKEIYIELVSPDINVEEMTTIWQRDDNYPKGKVLIIFKGTMVSDPRKEKYLGYAELDYKSCTVLSPYAILGLPIK